MCIGSRTSTLQNSTQKLAGQHPEGISQRSDLAWNTGQDILKIPNLRDAALERERRCISKFILKSKVTSNISRSSDSFGTVLPIVNEGDWGCIVRDLETIIVLVWLAINFIPQRSHHSLILPRSLIRDSATVTLTNGNGTTKVYYHTEGIRSGNSNSNSVLF